MKLYNNSIAYEHVSGNNGSIIFCGGLGSNMHGTKATALYDFCKKNDIAFTRFDYLGHGDSKGKFYEGNISIWLENSLEIFCNISQGKQIIIGSSMGGWIMLLMALKYPNRVKGLIGIAAAPDFTQDMQKSLTDKQKGQIHEIGYTYIPSGIENNPYLVTNDFLEDGAKNLLLNKESISISAPVILLHGMRDNIVSYKKSLELAEKIESHNVSVQLIKSSDHSMNDTLSLSALYRSVMSLL